MLIFSPIKMDPGDFDNSVIRTLDIILATREINNPIALERKSVMYLYADPELEKLPGLLKSAWTTGFGDLIPDAAAGRSRRHR